MFEKWLETQANSIKSIKVICCGDYKVGKSDFLRRYAGDSTANDNQDAGEVFVKLLTEPSLNMGVELYEFPSSANLDHQTCYTGATYDALVFFFETSSQKLREHLGLWLRHYFKGNPEDVWRIPILLVGLKKDRLTPLQFAHERSKREWEMKGIFRGDNMLFFGRDCDECDYYREMKNFGKFIGSVSRHNKQYDTLDYRQYLLNRSPQSYWMLYTVRELMELGFREAIGWTWRKLSRTTTDKLQQAD